MVEKSFMTERHNSLEYPLAKETITHDEIDELVRWLQTYPRLTKDVLTTEVEAQWANFVGSKYSVFCNSGSSANMLMIYSALRSGKLNNKKVIVPSVGWATTIAPFMQFGFDPIMVDADSSTFGVDLNQVEDVCKKHSPASVMFVQVLGVPHYKDELLQLKDQYGFYLFEDACAALGAEYSDGTKVGRVGDSSSFSLYFGHQLSTIEGGFVNTDDDELYNMMMMIRSHGWGKDVPKKTYDELIDRYQIDDFHKPFTFFEPGMNLRATDLQAFLGKMQIDKAPWVVNRRYENHLWYSKYLGDSVTYQDWSSNKPVSISFGCLASSSEHRRAIVDKLVEHKIETRVFSAGNLGRHPFWSNEYGAYEGEVADRIHSCGFFLPNYPELSEVQIKYISDIVNGVDL